MDILEKDFSVSFLKHFNPRYNHVEMQFFFKYNKACKHNSFVCVFSKMNEYYEM